MSLTRPDAPFRFFDAARPIYTNPRFLPGSRFTDCTLHDSIVGDGCFLDACTVRDSIVGIRTRARHGCSISRSVVLGADYYEPEHTGGPALGIGRDVVLDRVVVDKNARIGHGARLVNEAGVQHHDGEGYYIRNGITIVPKHGVIPPGTVL